MATQLAFNRLKGRENYSEWKIGARAHLIIKGLWNNFTKQLAEKADAKEKEIDLRAIGEITLLLEPCNYTHIETAQTAYDAWESIRKAFDDTGAGRKLALLQQFVSLKQKECSSMEDYVNKMCTLWSKIKECFKIDEEVAGFLMLVGLPAEYKPMVLAVENSGNTITVDYVKNLLLQGIMLDNEVNEGESALITKSKFKFNSVKKNKGCYGCGSTNHIVKNCQIAKDKKRQRFKNKKEAEMMLYSSMLVQSAEKSSDWFIDSGCTAHMTKMKSIITNQAEPQQKEVVVANNQKIKIDCVGQVKQNVLTNGKSKEITIDKVHFVPNICANLLSVSQIVKKGNSVLFTAKCCKIFDYSNTFIATGILVNDVFKLNTVQEEISFIANKTS